MDPISSPFTRLRASLPPLIPAPEPAPVSMLGSGDDALPDFPSNGSPKVTEAPFDPKTASAEEVAQQPFLSRLRTDEAKDLNPWGTPQNHPGFLGKFGHALSVITGGPNRRAFQEMGLAKSLQDLLHSQAESGLETAQAGAVPSETSLRQAQTENLEHPNETPLPTSSGYEGYNPKTGATTPITDKSGKPLMPYEKPGPLQHIVLQGPDGKPMVGFVDPQRGVTYNSDGSINPNPVPFEKPAAEHPVAGILNGAQKFGLYTPNGWVDPDTRQPMAGFQPAPTFAQTGLWQPTEGITQSGQLVPGKLNERSGQFLPNGPGGGPSALPKDVTAELGKELQTAREADKRLRIMEQNAQSAVNGDQQAMLSLVANHIGMTLGAQKGARINQAVWDEAIKSAPFLQNVTKKFDKDGYLEGVTLSPQQVKQMVDLGQVVRNNQWQQVEQTFSNYGINLAPEAQEKMAPGAGNNAPSGPPPGAVSTGRGSDGHSYYLDKDHKPIGRAD